MISTIPDKSDIVSDKILFCSSVGFKIDWVAQLSGVFLSSNKKVLVSTNLSAAKKVARGYDLVVNC